MAVEARLLHLLAGVVVGLHAHSRQLQLFCHIHVGVGDIDASVVDVRSSEDNILRTYFILLLGIFAAIEPCQVHHLPAAVREVSHHAKVSKLRMWPFTCTKGMSPVSSRML